MDGQALVEGVAVLLPSEFPLLTLCKSDFSMESSGHNCDVESSEALHLSGQVAWVQGAYTASASL